MILIKKIKQKIKAYEVLINANKDFKKYKSSIKPLINSLESLKQPEENKAFLIVSGNGMNVVWAQIWTVLSTGLLSKGHRGYVLTTKRQKNINRYLFLMRIKPIYLEDELTAFNHFPDLDSSLTKLNTFEKIRDYKFEEAPVGQIALSTYSRNNLTGVIDISVPAVLKEIHGWIFRIIKSYCLAKDIYSRKKIEICFFTEVFMEEYGAFYYASIFNNLNVVRFAGTVRDDAIIVQHLNKANDRTHHASISQSSWNKIKSLSLNNEIKSKLNQNFSDRYSQKWFRSKRNFASSNIQNVDEAKELLKIDFTKKTAVIYSHILYDTLFFFGTDLYKDYAEWLIETVKIACENKNINWMIKVHPSNIWRGEINLLKKKTFEEIYLIEKYIGKLPDHVRIVEPDTPINPYLWFQIADYSITVRGTAGLESAALGKTVITAGTGRYENNGFTVDPKDKQEYQKILKEIPNISAISETQKELAIKYAYSVFCLKPYTLTCLKPIIKTGLKTVRASDDLIYLFDSSQKLEKILPADIIKFTNWVFDEKSEDLLNSWN